MKHIIGFFLPICIFSFLAFAISVMVLGTAYSSQVDSVSYAEPVEYTEGYITNALNSENTVFTGEYSDIFVNAGACDVMIQTHDSPNTEVKIDESLFGHIQVTADGVLDIQADFNLLDPEAWESFIKGEFSSSNMFSSSIKILIPDKEYDTFNADMGAGSLEAYNIRSQNVYLNSRAGSTMYKNKSDYEMDFLNVTVGAGSAAVFNACTSEYFLDTSAGSLDVYGLTGEGSINVSAGRSDVSFEDFDNDIYTDVSAGNLNLYVPDDEEISVYSYRSAGDVKIVEKDGKTFSLANGSKYDINGGGEELSANVSAGSITVTVGIEKHQIKQDSSAATVQESSVPVITTRIPDDAQEPQEQAVTVVEEQSYFIPAEAPAAPAAPQAPQAPSAPAAFSEAV